MVARHHLGNDVTARMPVVFIRPEKGVFLLNFLRICRRGVAQNATPEERSAGAEGKIKKGGDGEETAEGTRKTAPQSGYERGEASLNNAPKEWN